MKKLVLILFLFLGKLLLAQNIAPQITNFNALVDTLQKKVTITYNVSDTENDTLHIYLRVSDVVSQTYLVNTNNATGDIGYPVMSGNNKSIEWTYTNLTGVSGNYAIKLIAEDKKPLDIGGIVAEVDSTKLKTDMQFLVGNRYYLSDLGKVNQTKDSIFTRFNMVGLNTTKQSFNYGGYNAQNIIGKHAGAVAEENVVIVDGHFDCVNGGPGADDNASAIIGVLEAARILSKYNFKKSINFIGFDLEELGLLGSKEYVNNGIKPYENIEAVLNMEMIGYYSNKNNSQSLPSGFNLLFSDAYNQVAADTFKGNFITNVANANSSSLMQNYFSNAALYVPNLKVINVEAPGNSEIAPDLRRSDHAAFWDKGYKALMLTDGANFRNKNYHTANDVADSLNFDFITNVVKAVIATASVLAEPMHADIKTTDVILPNVTTGLKNLSAKIEFKLIPNPANQNMVLNWFNPTINLTKINISDIQGKIVFETNDILRGVSDYTINTEHFPAGIYFVNVSASGQNHAIKFMVKH